ncbi:MAG: hypothetical protein K2J67_06715, partial [Lachnospiraceae bacterium]|nr:hypothetical protein [Lachnospiraceae bacterium]
MKSFFSQNWQYFSKNCYNTSGHKIMQQLYAKYYLTYQAEIPVAEKSTAIDRSAHLACPKMPETLIHFIIFTKTRSVIFHLQILSNELPAGHTLFIPVFL